MTAPMTQLPFRFGGDTVRLVMASLAHAMERLEGDSRKGADSLEGIRRLFREIPKKTSEEGVVTLTELPAIKTVARAVRQYNMDYQSGDEKFRPSLGIQLIATEMDTKPHPHESAMRSFYQDIERHIYEGQPNPWVEIKEDRIESLKKGSVVGFHPRWVEKDNPEGVRMCAWNDSSREWKSSRWCPETGKFVALREQPTHVMPQPGRPRL